MGKKKSNGGEAVAVVREFVLKVAMHCRCTGCRDKVRAAVRELTLAPGVEAEDGSAAESSGEVGLLATADPERLWRRLPKATGKKVDLLLPLPPSCKEQGAGGKKGGFVADAAALQALLAELQLQQLPARLQYGGGPGAAAAAAWAANQQQQLVGLGLGARGYGAAYPWATSSSSYYPAAAPAAAWGAYSYPPPAHVHGNLGYYGYGSVGGAPAWHGY